MPSVSAARSSARSAALAAMPVEAPVPLLSASPSLGSSVERGEAEPRKRRVRVERLAVDVDEEGGIEPDHRAGDIGERHEVARRADRAALVDMRMRAGVEEGDEPLDDLEPDARRALHQRIGAQQHRGAHVLGGQARPGRALVLPQREALDVGELVRADILVGHAAEQGGDAIDLLAPLDRRARMTSRDRSSRARTAGSSVSCDLRAARDGARCRQGSGPAPLMTTVIAGSSCLQQDRTARKRISCFVAAHMARCGSGNCRMLMGRA